MTHREADVLLSDGATVHVRPIRPEDADRIVALHSRFSQRTRYLRYFSAYPRIPPRDLQRFVNVDHHAREAFVVELGGDLIAVGRYEQLGDPSSQAEVAFVVEDAHQGRGIGSVLIEHLIAAARDEGIEAFVADVLPTNQTMLRVFSEAGFRIQRAFEEGVVHLWFPIAPTADSRRVQFYREQRAEARSIARILAPNGVAVYGARADGTGVGAAVLAHLQAAAFAGEIVPVHPSATTVGGLPAVPTLDGVEGIDLAVVVVPADAVPGVVEDCARAGVHGLVVVSSGFAESGPDGLLAQDALLRAVRGKGMRLVGPNCLGIANTHPAVRLNATLAPLLPRPGRVGFFSQSAALGTALLAEADRRGIGLSSFISAGNRADVSGNDALQYWRGDHETEAVLLYLETFGNPRKFARIARELARHKPVVAVASPVRPDDSGPDARGVAALFANSGVIRVDTVAELFDVGALIAGWPLPEGDRIAVVTNAAALEALTVVKAPAAGVRIVASTVLPPTTTEATFVLAVGEALKDPEVDAVLAAFAPVLLDEHGDVAEALRTVASTVASTAADGAGKPLAAVLPADPSFTVAPTYVDGDPLSLPIYPAIEEAVRALGRVAQYAAWRREPLGTLPPMSNVGSLPPSTPVEAVLAAYGITVVPSKLASREAVVEAAAAYGQPVALKVAGSPWRHRVDLGAVRLNLATPTQVFAAYEELEQLFGPDVEVVVQPIVPPGVACVVEVVDDPAFGPVVGFGLGGEAAELLGDRAWRPVPLTDRDAFSLVRAPKAAPLLTGYRGSAPVDLDALADLVLRIGQLVDEQPTLSSLALNPVLARPYGISVLHASVVFADAATRPDTGPRRL
jgi:acyl-CoA synthetase (NDP forming)/RimJ/RimL family protein N-acetyltransferase